MLKLVFLVLVLLLGSITDFYPKYRIYSRLVSWFALSVFAGLRQVGGADYLEYVENYTFPHLGDGNWESGYVFLEESFNSLDFNYSMFQFAITSFSIFIFIRFIYKYSKQPQLSVFIFLGTYFLFYNMVLNRQMVALAFAYLALEALLEKKHLLFYVWIIVGYYFHMSILILIPLYIFSQKMNFRYAMIGIPILVVCVLLAGNFTSFLLETAMSATQVDLLGSKGGNYFLESDFNVNAFEYIRVVLIMSVLWYFRECLNEREKIYVFSFLLFSLFLIAFSKVEILIRMCMYFDLLTLLLIPNMLLKIKNQALYYTIYIGLVGVFVGVFCIRILKFENGEFIRSGLYLFDSLY